MRPVTGVDGFDGEAVGVLQEAGDIPHPLRNLERDDPITRPVIHIDDRQHEALAELRAQQQSPVVHGIAEDRVERVAVHSWTALVSREHEECLGGTVLAGGIALEFDLGHRGTGPAHISGGGVGQQVLARAVEPGSPGFVGGRHKAVPGEPVGRRGADPVRVAHNDRDVVPRVSDETIEQQTPSHRVAHAGAHGLEHARRRPSVAADGTDVRLDDRERDPHGKSSFDTAPQPHAIGMPRRPRRRAPAFWPVVALF